MRSTAVTALLVVVASCRDDDVTDDPIFPDNVAATLESCELVDGSPLASVAITNGTGHEAVYRVMVQFRTDDRVVGAGTGRSTAIRPAQTQTVAVPIDSDDVTAVDACDIQGVEEVDPEAD